MHVEAGETGQFLSSEPVRYLEAAGALGFLPRRHFGKVGAENGVECSVANCQNGFIGAVEEETDSVDELRWKTEKWGYFLARLLARLLTRLALCQACKAFQYHAVGLLACLELLMSSSNIFC